MLATEENTESHPVADARAVLVVEALAIGGFIFNKSTEEDVENALLFTVFVVFTATAAAAAALESIPPEVLGIEIFNKSAVGAAEEVLVEFEFEERSNPANASSILFTKGSAKRGNSDDNN